jgi:hypothetical protein
MLSHSVKEKEAEKIVQENQGIRLDIGCGRSKSPGFVGLDILDVPGVDVVHDINVHPWPLPDSCVLVASCSHLVEHIPPVAFKFESYLCPNCEGKGCQFCGDFGIITNQKSWFPFIEFMDEVWRLMVPGGQFSISCPHGASPGFLQDPTHINGINEATFAYFTPAELDGLLYNFYRPKPWHFELQSYDPAGNCEVILRKIELEAVEIIERERKEKIEQNGQE